MRYSEREVVGPGAGMAKDACLESREMMGSSPALTFGFQRNKVSSPLTHNAHNIIIMYICTDRTGYSNCTQ